MENVNFAITINLSLALEDDRANIRINNVELKPAIISLPIRLSVQRQPDTVQPKRKTIHGIVLESARKHVSETGLNEFSGADLLRLARETYSDLKRSSFSAHVIAAAPNHSSYHHYEMKKDYLFYLGNGKYKLEEKYLDPISDTDIRPSDEVRQYTKKQYIDPAREIGESYVSIRAGNVHKELGFSQRLPLVCGALRSRKFLELCEIELVETEGPDNSTTTTFKYII